MHTAAATQACELDDERSWHDFMVLAAYLDLPLLRPGQFLSESDEWKSTVSQKRNWGGGRQTAVRTRQSSMVR